MRKIYKQIIAYVLVAAMLIPSLPVMEAKAADEIVYDFGAPTGGVAKFTNFSNNTMEGLEAAGSTVQAGMNAITKSYAGSNWALDPNTTTTGIYNGDIYWPAGTSSAYGSTAGAVLQSWSGNPIFLQVNWGASLGFNIQAPAGEYTVFVDYNSRTGYSGGTVKINGATIGTVPAGTADGNTQTAYELADTVTLTEGTNALVLTSTNTGTGVRYPFMVRSVRLVPVEGSATPTPTPTTAPASSITYDLASPTTGVYFGEGHSSGINDESTASGALPISTYYAGTGWRINNELTNAPKDASDADKYVVNTSGGAGTAGISIQKWGGDTFRVVNINKNLTMGFDLTVPEAGYYDLTIQYNERNISIAADVKVNGQAVGSVPAGTTGSNGYTTVSLGNVAFYAGDFANTITFTTINNQKNSSMIRSIILTKVGTAVPTPMPTAAPTPVPTVAPTPSPTPVPTPAPTLDPNATQAPFSVNMQTVETSSMYTADNVRFYLQKTTHGENWKVSESTDPATIVQGTTISYAARFFDSQGVVSYLQTYKTGVNHTLAFTAPQGGEYDLTANIVWLSAGGYGDIFVNGKYVGTVDANASTGVNAQKLLGVTLYAGPYANTVTVKANGKSTGSNQYVSFRSFDFVPAATAAKLTGIDAQIDSTQLYVGDQKTITTLGATTNGTHYRLPSAGVTDVVYSSSNSSVASVNASTGVVKALAAGTATITAKSASLGFVDTILLKVDEVAYTTAEVNIEEGQIFVARDTHELKVKAKFNNGQYAPDNQVTVVYESSDESVVKEENGILKAVGKGTAKVTAKVTYNNVTNKAERNVEVLEFIPPENFSIDFSKTTNFLTRPDGQAWYMSKDTYGDIWRVSDKTSAGVLGTSPDNLASLRVFFGDNYTYFRTYTGGKDYVFDFTAPIPGTYDIVLNEVTVDSGGYAEIYVNDVYVGSIDGYDKTSALKEQKLIGVKLNAGEFANQIKFVPSDRSGGTNNYCSVSSVDFIANEGELAKLAGIEATADVSAMYVGREEQISVEAILSNGGLYRLSKAGETLQYSSSNPSVATVSNTGLITAVAGGDVEITVKTSETNLSDKISFHVTDSPYDKVIMNVTEGEEFYVTNERPLEVTATLEDGTVIAQKDLIIEYKSSNESVAKIENNVLKIVAKGTAKITADVKFRVTGVTKSDAKNISATTIPLKGITAVTEKPVVQALDTNGVPLIVKGIAYDDSIVEDLVAAGFTSLEYEFTALNPDILTIDDDGTCHYVSRGDAQIYIDAKIDGVPFNTTVDVVSSSSKTGRTIYTDAMVEAAQYNAKNTSWGSYETKRTESQVYKFTFSTEEYYDLIPSEGVPRSNDPGTRWTAESIKHYCPYCGVNVQTQFGGKWKTDPILYPWKIECPNCYQKFPSNDFALLYERGLDENGHYDRELAYQRNAEAVARGEKDALINESFPDKGPTWMVDDGFGWSPAEGTYGTKDQQQFTAVAYYHHLFWYKAPVYHMYFVLYKLRDAYLWTGNDVYGKTGAILLDRIADVYPDYDVTQYSIAYSLAQGGRNSGRVLGCIWDYFIAEYFIDCYDAFYPLYDDPEVVEFLSRKSQELGLENPKNTPDLIRENIENGIVREALEACYEGDIWGNFGMEQIVAAKAAAALDTYPETQIALDWLEAPSSSPVQTERVTEKAFDTAFTSHIANTGGQLGVKFTEGLSRDGFGNEVALGYNVIWLQNSMAVAEVLNNYGAGLDLYDNPKFVKMFDSFIHMTLGDDYSLSNGDSGSAADPAFNNYAKETMQAYKATRDPRLAQIYDYYVKGDYRNSYIDMYSDPRELITAIQADVAQYGKLELESENLTGYGLAVVRGGEAATKDNQWETRYDTWMYYGPTWHSHAHNDALQMGVDAYGFNFNPDLGYPEATASTANRYEWVKNSISHNVVLVNEKEQKGINDMSVPLHFDSTEDVKLIDAEANEAYDETSIYRRTAVTIKANDDVAYTLDFFRVKGGTHHMYSFHSSSYDGAFTEDIDFVPQMNEKGEYAGTYAGIDVPYGPDPNSTDDQYAANPVYQRGYTWLTHVNRGTDKTNDGYFAVNFDQTDFKHQVVNSTKLKFKFHSVNDWTPSSVDIVRGYAPRIAKNEPVEGLDYMFIHREAAPGQELDTLFTSVWEPYKDDDGYILSTSDIVPSVKSGTLGADDVAKVVKVVLKSGRTDYIVYATNNDVLYNITDGDVSFDFQGFVGVYSVDYFGNNIYSYVNDGTVIGDQTSSEGYTGTVVDFTKELAFENSITIALNEEIEDVTALNNQYIYINNNKQNGVNGVYRIVTAEQDGDNIVLHLGNASTVEGFIDQYDLDGGYVYAITEGQDFRIPVSTVVGGTTGFGGTSNPGGGGNGGGSDNGADAATDAATDADATSDLSTAPGDDDEYANLIADSDASKDVDDEELADEDAKDDDDNDGVGEPTATPAAEPVSTASNHKVRNLLLGGLGVLAAVAGFILILLGKKKDEDEEEAV